MKRAAGVDQLCSLMTKMRLDILGNENSVQHLLDMYDNISSVRSRWKGSTNLILLKIV